MYIIIKTKEDKLLFYSCHMRSEERIVHPMSLGFLLTATGWYQFMYMLPEFIVKFVDKRIIVFCVYSHTAFKNS